VSAFANYGRAVAHVRGSYVPTTVMRKKQSKGRVGSKPIVTESDLSDSTDQAGAIQPNSNAPLMINIVAAVTP
jgi:hypothetical protein